MQLSPDGELLTFLRARPDDSDRYDLWAMDIASGAERMLVDSKKVGTGAELSEQEKMQRERQRIGGRSGIVSYEWSPNGKSILVPLDGDLYLPGLDGSVRRLTATEAAELNPVVSPDGSYISFVRDNNLFAGKIGGAEPRQITDGKGDPISWGTAEFVAQEEMDRDTGYWWAPDDSRIAVQRTDETPVGIFTRAAIGADGTKVYEQRYPAAGKANALVSLYVMDPDGGNRVQVNMGPNPDIYLARVNWSQDGKTLYVQRESRDQKTLDLLQVDPATGKSSVLFTEKTTKPDSWLNLSHNFRSLKDGSLLWWSERSGHGHLYHYQAGQWTQLTKGDWEVEKVVGIDEARDRIYFSGNQDKPLEKQLYYTRISKPGDIVQLTENGWSNYADINESASRVVISRSNTEHPPQSYVADTDGKRLQWIAQNDIDAGHPYAPYLASHSKTEFGTIQADDGTELHYYMITPDPVPGKKYPVWMQHYGGPGAQNVTNSWKGALPQYIVDQGYIFFELDNRGMTGRGKAFEDQIYHAMGTVEVADQLKAADFLKSLPIVDKDKITTFGWSYGGYMTLKLLEASQGVFAAGVAVAPVTKWELYDTHYTERYLGDPGKTGDVYTNSGTLADSAKITDPLLIVHGLADDNVFFDNSSLMIAKMQADDQTFDMALYPGKTHGIAGVKPQLYATVLDFLNRYTGGAKPADTKTAR